MLTQLNAWVAKMSLALSIPTKDELFMFQKTKIKFYIGKPKICLTNEIHANSFAYNNKRNKTKGFTFQKKATKKNRLFKLVKQENMLDSLNLSMALQIIPK